VAAKRKKEESPGIDPNAWMLTFSDLITLLLTFFVMLLTMSSMDVERIQRVFSSFTGGSGILDFTDMGRISSFQEQLRMLSQLTPEKLPDEEILRDVFLGAGKPGATGVLAGEAAEIRIKKTEDGVALVFGASIFFEPGQATIKAEGMKILALLADIIKQVDRPISIEGHTDSIPVSSDAFDGSNWNLSLARALAVRDALVDQLEVNPWRMRVAALADSRPVTDESTPEGRAENRRLEVVFEWLS